MQSTFILGSKETTALMAAAIEKANALSLVLSIAITDLGGHLLAFHRMDGAMVFSVNIAIGKAKTSAISGKPSAVFEESAANRPALLSIDDTVLMQGGLPIIIDGRCIGAVGVSGASSQEDEDVARAAIAAL